MKEAVVQMTDGFNSYGPLIQTLQSSRIDGGTEPFPVLNLASMLQGSFAQGGYWENLLTTLHRSRPSSLDAPWQGILYCDEVHPGNQLSGSSRKIWAVYFSWLQLGQKLLTNESHWFTLMVLRTDQVQTFHAGIGQCVRLLLEFMFANEHGNPQHGITLCGKEQSLRLHWTLDVFLQDGSAQKQTFSNRQDSGSRVCMLCRNIFAIGTEETLDEDLTISARHLTMASCELATDAELLQSWDRLAQHSQSDNKGTFKMRQQASGWTFSEAALLMSPVLRSLGLLRPATQYCFDYMHGLCSNGVLCFVLFWAFTAFQQKGLPQVWHGFKAFVQLWHWPLAQKQNSLHKLFSAEKVKSHRKAGHFKASASEMLALSRPLQHFLETYCVLPEVQVYKDACVSWFRLLDMLVVSATSKPQPGQVLAACEHAMNLSVAAGWGDRLRPKFHWALHYEACLNRFSCLPACWSLERKHKVVRKYGSASTNTRRFDQSLLEEVTAEHLAILCKAVHFQPAAHLVDPYPVPPKQVSALVAANIITATDNCCCSSLCHLASGAPVSKKDFVLHKPPAHAQGPMRFCCGRVEHLLQVGDVAAAVVSVCTPLSIDSDRRVAKWQHKPSDMYIMEADAMICSTIHNLSDDQVTTLLPGHLCHPA